MTYWDIVSYPNPLVHQRGSGRGGACSNLPIVRNRSIVVEGLESLEPGVDTFEGRGYPSKRSRRDDFQLRQPTRDLTERIIPACRRQARQLVDSGLGLVLKSARSETAKEVESENEPEQLKNYKGRS